MATKLLTVNPWLTPRSAFLHREEGQVADVRVCVSCVWLECCFSPVPSPRLGGFLFVCLFAYSRHWIWYHIYLGWSRHCSFQILGPTSLHHYGWLRRTSPMWPPFVGSIWQVCSQKVGPSAEYAQSGGVGENQWSCPSAVVPAWPASLSVWILALLF